MSAPVSRPRCRHPVTSMISALAVNASMASATNPSYQARLAASICASLSAPAASASARIRL